MWWGGQCDLCGLSGARRGRKSAARGTADSYAKRRRRDAADGRAKTTSVKELANDVTVSGERATAYVTETFAGDGTTTIFQLSGDPFRPKKTSNSSQFLTDGFDVVVPEAQIGRSPIRDLILA